MPPKSRACSSKIPWIPHHIQAYTVGATANKFTYRPATERSAHAHRPRYASRVPTRDAYERAAPRCSPADRSDDLGGAFPSFCLAEQDQPAPRIVSDRTADLSWLGPPRGGVLRRLGGHHLARRARTRAAWGLPDAASCAVARGGPDRLLRVHRSGEPADDELDAAARALGTPTTPMGIL